MGNSAASQGVQADRAGLQRAGAESERAALHKHIDYFVHRMKSLDGDAVSLATWLNWLFVDIPGDMAHNCEMNAMRDSMATATFVLITMNADYE